MTRVAPWAETKHTGMLLWQPTTTLVTSIDITCRLNNCNVLKQTAEPQDIQ